MGKNVVFFDERVGADMMKYEMNLNNDPFNKIKEGTKTMELRLNDEKR